MTEGTKAPPDQPKPIEVFPEEAPRRGKRALLIFLAAAILGAGGYAAYKFRPSSGTSSLRYDTAKIDRGRIVAKVTATGTLSALVTVQVGSQVSGTLKEILVDFNAEVKKDQVLARIDSRLFDAALQQAKANVAAAKGNLAKAKAQAVDADQQYARAKALVEKGISTEADLGTAQANAEAAKAQVEAAEGSLSQTEAALHQAEVNLGYATIVSPINGQVISRNVDVGQTVAASLQAPVLFQIAEDLRRMQVDTSVAEADVGKLQSGMAASFTVDAYPGERFRGKVRQVRMAPQTVQNVVTYDAVIDVENPDLKLMPGMTATVTFICQQKDDVLRIPNAALRFRPPPELLATLRGAAGGNEADAPVAGSRGAKGAGSGSSEKGVRRNSSSDRRTAWILRSGEPQQVSIRTGISDGSFTELVVEEGVESPLKEGDEMIAEAYGGETGGAGTKGSSGSFRRLF